MESQQLKSLAIVGFLGFVVAVGLVVWKVGRPSGHTAKANPSISAHPDALANPGQVAKPSRDELRRRLTPEQFWVTQEDGTEKPFKNAYWDKKDPGIYVDVVSGEALFSSLDKFDSGTGWPSFTRPLVASHIVEREDKGFFSVRTEIRSKRADSHLGHVFDDGPPPTGKRYCMNSAALRFVPAAQLVAQGYGEFATLFGTRDSVAVATEKAYFAGGCFWCMEPPFEKLDGVLSVVSGYTGGSKPNPTYEQVSRGGTGHVETVEVTFEPHRISYEKLLEVYWRSVDPTDGEGQFVDRGAQYRPVIFVTDESQRGKAAASKERLGKLGTFSKPIVVEILPAKPFYQAEEYHQDYYKKNGLKYKYYRYRSGRDQFLERTWGKAKGG